MSPLTTASIEGDAVETTEPDLSLQRYREQQMSIPGMDGYRASKLALNFAGQVELDDSASDDVDFVNGLKMFDEVRLTVVATVLKKGFYGIPGKNPEGKNPAPDQIGYAVALRVSSLEVQ